MVSKEESSGSEERPTRTTYTYRRKIVRREQSDWNREEPGSDRSNEKVVEETVTSPEEVPEPFPSGEERPPDVIVFHQVGTRFRFIHRAYRYEETKHWRVETLPGNPTVADGPANGDWPVGLVVPPGLRYKTLDEHPVDPRFVLEFCLNPSVPKPPIPYGGFSRYSPIEIAHVLACGESIWMVVDLLDGVERARAAASAWYAQRFVLDLVTQFGPIVHTVCIIRDSVAVVELTRAKLTGAVAWAALSGAGTYLLHIDDGKVEEKVFPGCFSRAGCMDPGVYVKLLERYGWARSDARGLRGAVQDGGGRGWRWNRRPGASTAPPSIPWLIVIGLNHQAWAFPITVNLAAESSAETPRSDRGDLSMKLHHKGRLMDETPSQRT